MGWSQSKVPTKNGDEKGELEGEHLVTYEKWEPRGNC